MIIPFLDQSGVLNYNIHCHAFKALKVYLKPQINPMQAFKRLVIAGGRRRCVFYKILETLWFSRLNERKINLIPIWAVI